MSDRGSAIAIAHSCEGAGHATRMLAVVEELERAGHEPIIAGGGPGTQFVERNGYSEFVPREVDFVGGYQQGNLLVVLKRSLPNVYARVTDYVSWLEREAPQVLVADDVCAALAATIAGTTFVYVSHDPAAFYADRTERVGARGRNWFARRTADVFLLPKVWDGPPTVTGAVSIPPIAHEAGAGDRAGGDDRGGDDDRDAGDDDRGAGDDRSGGDDDRDAGDDREGTDPAVDVLVVPSDFSVEQDRLASALERRGRDVTLVGGDDWELAESLQPHVEAAALVVCSGYSTVMEAAVAGTPCVILPHTSEQRGVARAVSELDGFYSAETVADVGSMLDRVERPERHENGARNVADAATILLDR